MQAAFRDNHGLQCGYWHAGNDHVGIDIVNRYGDKLDEDTSARAGRQYLPLHRLPTSSNRCSTRPPHEGLAAAGIAPQATTTLIQDRRVSWNGGNNDSCGGQKGVEALASVVRKETPFHYRQGPLRRRYQIAGMTHAHFVRSPHAHAKVKGIDSSAAMKMPAWSAC